jgi:hypothetical protein
MNLRHLGAGALALAMLVFVLSTPPALAQTCQRLDRSRGAVVTVPCIQAIEGRAVKRDRRNFREGRKARGGLVSPRLPAGVAADRAVAQTDNDGRIVAGAAGEPMRLARTRAPAGASLGGIVAPLAAKAAEIVSGCGSRVVSGVRHTLIAGTRTLSLHASGRAVDVAGNPSCIYRHLAGWPGGYSTDYGRVRHVHISYGGREDGLRFAHGGGRRHIKRARMTRVGQ